MAVQQSVLDAAWHAARRKGNEVATAADTARTSYLFGLSQYQQRQARDDAPPAGEADEKRLDALGVETLNFLNALASLGQDECVACHGVFAPGCRPLPDAAKPVFAKHPALQRWQDRREAAAAATDAANAERQAAIVAARDAEEAERERGAPARLLADLACRRIAIAVDRNGSITASPAGALLAEHVEALRKYKPEVVALLRETAEAAKPFVIA